MLNPAELKNLSATAEKLTVEQLHELYDTLPAVECESMIGDWKGSCFNTGHTGEGKLSALGWAGKSFRSANDVMPIMSLNENGELVENPIMGTASLRKVEFRGVATATMVYDQHPIFDHFKKVDEQTVLGVMDAKGDAFPLYFLLVKA
ncbi:DUF4334 domain-containing protein [Spongiibacter sp. KMU-158]|uniref:DUF4334 domain-containing protein n=1 Tax=Spongiibacter pelagi TaxID=2760804 RepID=A0A927C2D7_9GAMM|nr:DUF4334 domain-containing protein [Spongiibacter pelagi]MBD2858908.1 DUF4334 domain-containing protein [Spongiibacter pelagi]